MSSYSEEIKNALKEMEVNVKALEEERAGYKEAYEEVASELEWLYDFLGQLGIPAPAKMTVHLELEIKEKLKELK